MSRILIYVLLATLSFFMAAENINRFSTNVADTVFVSAICEPFGLTQAEGTDTIAMALGQLICENYDGEQTNTVQIHDLPNIYDVKDYGAKGNGMIDDTAAIQRAIEDSSSSGGGIVYIPDGVYMINPEVSLKVRSDIELHLSNNAVLKAMPTAKENYIIVEIFNVSNVSVVGGKIVGDRYQHLGTSGEGGIGIEIMDSSNIRITDISISNCWGDGIYIGTVTTSANNNNIAIERFICDNNRRHGIAVISVNNLTIRDGVCSNTNGGSVSTQSGLDLEPNYATQTLTNVLIENLRTVNCGGYGLDFWLGNDSVKFPNDNVSVVITNHTDNGSHKGTLHDISQYIKAGYSICVN